MVLMMGAPGSGKGTQSEILVQKYGYKHLSTGEMLRTYASDEQKARMASGVLLEDEEVIALVEKALSELADPSHALLDGFPRTIAQTDWLLEKSKNGSFAIDAVINLAAEPEALIERLLNRGRPDDTRESLVVRLQAYKEQTFPILSHLREQGVSVSDINADQTPEMVHNQIIELLEDANAR